MDKRKKIITFTEVEVRHILTHLEDNDSNEWGYYWGNPEQFRKRHDGLIDRLKGVL